MLSNSTIRNCIFINNIAIDSGGGLYINQPISLGSTLNQTSSIHTKQISNTKNKKALLDSTSTPLIENCQFINNQSPIGSSVASLFGATFRNCSFSNTTVNTMDGQIGSLKGSAMFIDSDLLVEFDQCSFSNFRVHNLTGGALVLVLSSVRMTRCTFTNNSLVNDFSNQGGVISAVQAARVEISNSTFIKNSAGIGGLGGCIFADSFSALNISDCEFQYNSALLGGAFYLANEAGTLISASRMHNNRATFGGGMHMIHSNEPPHNQT